MEATIKIREIAETVFGGMTPPGVHKYKRSGLFLRPSYKLPGTKGCELWHRKSVSVYQAELARLTHDWQSKTAEARMKEATRIAGEFESELIASLQIRHRDGSQDAIRST